MRGFKRLLSVSLVLLLLLALLPAHVYAEADEIETLEAAFAEPAMRYRPYARWWLAEGSHTDETLIESIHELYDAGYGGVEFVTLDESRYLNKADYAWGSPEWIHDTRVIIETCRELGMSVSMTSGTHWATANLMSITPDEEAASQELGYATATLEENEDDLPAFDGKLPKCKLPSKVKKSSLVAVLAFPVTERGSAKLAKGKVSPTRLDLENVQDLTRLVDSDGGLRWTAPTAGDWELFAFYQYGTGESYSPAVSPSYTINYLSDEGAKALIDYWDSEVLTEEVRALIEQIDECGLYMDSLELSVHGSNTTGQLWCADMLEQFAARNTYSIETLLPFLIKTGGSFGAQNVYYYEPAEETQAQYISNMRFDFMQTQTELYMENCLGLLADWLHSRHMVLRAENSYGAPFEISEPALVLDYIETESMEFGNELDSHRNMAGGAHLFNKRLSSETGAWISGNYVYDNNYYRQVFYMQYAAGVQKTVTHGYSSAYGPEECVQWPGYEGMDAVWSERFNKRQPASVDYPAQNLHYSRLQQALEAGVPQMDLAILRTDYNFNNRLTNGGMTNFVEKGVYSNKAHTQDAWYWRDLSLQNAGYTYDYFSPYLLTADGVSCTNGLVNAEGAAYQALILFEDELPLEAAETILSWAQDGLPVLLVNNAAEIVSNDNVMKQNTVAASATGSNNASDEELAAIRAELTALENVRVVESESEALPALQELGVYPRVRYAEPNTVLLPVLRRDGDTDYLYLYHYMYEDTEDFSTTISVEGVFEPYVLDTWSGRAELARSFRIADGRTEIDVTLAPGETLLLALCGGTDLSDSYTHRTETSETFIPLERWTLVVDSFEPGEKLTRVETNPDTGLTTTEVAYDTRHVLLDAGELQALVPWRELEAVGETVSGVGSYETGFVLAASDLAEGTRVFFQADSFCGGTAAVFCNGQAVSVNMDSRTAELTSAVQEGENTLQVRVTSSLRNRMREIGYDQGWNILHPDAADYGMTGEASLKLVRIE